MTGENDNRKKEAKGFAGLSDLVPDIDATPPPVARPEPRVSAGGMPAPTKTASSPPPVKPPNQNQPRPVAPPPSSDSSAGKWVLGIALVFGVLWLIGQADKKPSSRSAGTPGAATQAPTRPEESKPPIGQDLVFSTAQIRYCLAEDIRMDAAKSVLNNYSDADVDQFNAMVSDYNSRCGSFRYRSGALESARRDIEPYRSQLQTEGRSRFARSPPSASLPVSAPSRPAPDATVLAIQQKLNELGYDAGTVDGLMGRGTRSAILAFQQAQGLAGTGVADEALLLQLRLAHSRMTGQGRVKQEVEQVAPSQSEASNNTHTAAAPKSESVSISAQPPSTPTLILAAASESEKAAIENACGYYKRNSGPGDYYSCLRREMTSLANSAGRPELSQASSSEQASIENSCGYHKRNSGPGDYYSCLRRELASLRNSAGKPDISRASASEQLAIENACGYHKRNSGPGEYYSCLRRELAGLANSAGRPDLSRASSSEQSAIENACGYHKRNSGPGEYYGCLRRELASLVNSGGAPDFSRVNQFEQAAIEEACGYHRHNSGPGDYYSCLRRELNEIAQR